MPIPLTMHRRKLLKLGAASLGVAVAPSWIQSSKGQTDSRPKVAIVLTEFTYRSHAHVILENFLEPYLFNGKKTDPGVDVASLYVDQFPPGDMSRQVARDYGLTIYPSIGEALRVGTAKLAVDGVVSIGEHGQYPVNAKGQIEYPRKRFFDDIVAEFRRSGRSVPVFNDKHLSYRRDWAIEMVETAKKLGFAFMAGSSVPLATRQPMVEFPAGAKLRGAVSIHGGGVESYDFHCLEVLQAMVESRAGGETGVAEVRFVEGEALWRAAEAGEWSIQLADAAMAADLGPGQPSLPELVKTEAFSAKPHGILLTYRDGLKAIALKIGSRGTRWSSACQIEGQSEPIATSYYVGPWDNRNLFRALSHAIQECIKTSRPSYSVERTLLTTCVLDAAMDSRAASGQTIRGDDLAIAYQPIDFKAMREMGETWKILTPETPQPQGIDISTRERTE
jgi:hypothetical protein